MPGHAIPHSSGLSLGQLMVDGKNNEITAVPKLLCQLGLTFGEDQCRARKGNAAQNLALLRKLALSLLRHDKTTKDTMRGKQIRAALCENPLQILMELDSPK